MPLGAAFSAGIVSGVKYNSQMEQYITSFGTMLGSAEKATALVNDLKEMGAKTPFETADLAKDPRHCLPLEQQRKTFCHYANARGCIAGQ